MVTLQWNETIISINKYHIHVLYILCFKVKYNLILKSLSLTHLFFNYILGINIIYISLLILLFSINIESNNKIKLKYKKAKLYKKKYKNIMQSKLSWKDTLFIIDID